MKKIRVRLGKKGYDIVVGYNIIPRIGGLVKRLRLGKDAIIITNPAIKRAGYARKIERALKSSRFSVHIITIPGKETSKSIREVIRLHERIADIDKGRGIFIVALGGGMTGDIAGFVASTYKRGIPYIQVPTTLLAQVDSAIGGKTAINLSSAKNLVGAFYQPKLVFSDIMFLKGRLPQRIFISGLGEIIKYGIIDDRRFFSFLEQNVYKILRRDKASLEHIIYTSSRIKARFVEKDEYDTKGIRAKLNFGHTIGHAIENASKYSNQLYYHGEAVAIGMIAACHIASSLGHLKKGELGRITGLVKRMGLPISISKGLDKRKIMAAQRHDKKIIHGVNRFILPVKIGKVKIYEKIPRDIIRKSLSTMHN